MTRLEPIAPSPAEPQTDATSADSRPGMPASAWSGLALVGGLIPLVGLGGLRALGPISLPESIASVATWAVAVGAGGATVAAIAAALRRGRVTRFLDATAMGALAACAAAAATVGSPMPGVVVGVVAMAPVLLVASLLMRPRLGPGLPRGAASVAAFLAIETALGAALVLQSPGSPVEIPGWLLGGVAAVLLASSVAAFERPLRVLAATSGAAAAAIMILAVPGAGSGAVETLPALVGLLIVSVALPLSYQFDQLHGTGRATGAAPDRQYQRPVAALLPDPSLDAELDDARRLARELRATIEELSAARRTVELQRNEIDRLARVDALTGVSPRPAVLERLRIETAAARRYAHPFAVALLDIDGMGDLNRRHGREVGDQVLREVALRLRVRTRTADAIGRINGDAFLAILPHTDERGATVFADAMRRLASDRPILTDAGEVRISLSIGVAIMRAELALTDDQLLTAVHEALASAKASGGNRIAFDRLHGFARPEGPSASGGAAPSETDEPAGAPAEIPMPPASDDTR